MTGTNHKQMELIGRNTHTVIRQLPGYAVPPLNNLQSDNKNRVGLILGHSNLRLLQTQCITETLSPLQYMYWH